RISPPRPRLRARRIGRLTQPAPGRCAGRRGACSIIDPEEERIMAGRAAIARHPIHPMFVAFPIRLWVFSFACDRVYHWGNHALFWKDAAFYTMIGGVVGALFAALPGLVDYLALVGQRVKRIATSHMVLNLIIVVLYVVNLVWRGTSAPPDAVGPVW